MVHLVQLFVYQLSLVVILSMQATLVNIFWIIYLNNFMFVSIFLCSYFRSWKTAGFNFWRICCFHHAFFSVTDDELVRIQAAYKRACGYAGIMREVVFVRDVLGDFVPAKLAQVCWLKKHANVVKMFGLNGAWHLFFFCLKSGWSS